MSHALNQTSLLGTALDTDPPAAAVPDVDGEQHLSLNGNGPLDDYSNGSTKSPETPVSPFNTHVKIDINCQEQESDARHEPMTKLDQSDKLDVVSTLVDAMPPAETITSIDLASPSLEDLPHDTPMIEAEPQGLNGVHHDDDYSMTALQSRSPSNIGSAGMEVDQVAPETPFETTSAMAASPDMMVDRPTTSNTPVESPRDDDGMPPPAKRARKHSDADQASLAHSSMNQSTSPPPVATATTTFTNGTSTPVPQSSPELPASTQLLPPSTLSTAQFRFAQSTVRTLKKLKDAVPFLRPVDPVALNIPHYPTIIKTPMDFSTVERKLNSSNPAKPDLNLLNPRYLSADAFISDVRLIFQNCLAFNGPDHAVTLMGKRVEEVFDKQLKQMPPTLEPKPFPVKKATPPPPAAPPPPPAVPKKQPARRPSTSIPVIRRSETEAAIGRPKREIHPPPPKDLPYADAPKKPRRNKRIKDDGTNEQLKFCAKLLTDLHRKQHYSCAHPFYEPVDWVKLELPSYPKIIKKPMDLSTMRKKLETRDYSGAQKFYDDFKLMIRNCFTFNPAGTPVNQAGIELQKLFDEKWKNLPALHDVSDDDDDDDDDDSEEERTRAIAAMESQIETMRGSIAALKGSKPAKEKKKKEKRDKAPTASSSKGKSGKSGVGKKKSKKQIADDDVLSFEQKKDLSEAIVKLDGTKLEKVIQIIHEGVPEIRDSTEEIELEIDLLPATVLTKLYNFVLRPLRAPATKRNRTGKGTGTGGLKRKSMDEDVEAEKIRRLEERMRMFEEGPSTTGFPGGAASGRNQDDSDRSSDSSSDDSSGSDSD